MDYLDEKDFVYLGLELKSVRKGDGKALYHKVLVKERPLLESINKFLKEDKMYIPIPGKVLPYTSFFSYICHNNVLKKKHEDKEKEIIQISKTHTILQIDEMEKKGLELLDIELDKELNGLLEQRNEVEVHIANNSNTVSDLDSYKKVKEMLDGKLSEFYNRRMELRAENIDRFAKARRYRVDLEVHKAGQVVERNAKRRQKRLESKNARLRIDNELGVVVLDESIQEVAVSEVKEVADLVETGLEAVNVGVVEEMLI